MNKRFAALAQTLFCFSCFLLLAASVSGQDKKTFLKTVTGLVTDTKGEPIEGASVQVKGKTYGTTTNQNGVYTLVIRDSANFMIIFSATNFLTKEIRLAVNVATLNAVLEDNIKSLDDVVVIGYGTVRRKDLTGSVGRANVEDMKKAPVSSFAEALAGRVAGVQVTTGDGQPGSDAQIVVRGNNSVTQDNSPLYVIDGFPAEASMFNLLNPEEIESTEVLKDASATAIYGARGANGVILITTKKGRIGAPVVTYDTWVGVHQNVKQMEMMSPYEFVKYQIEQNPSASTPIYLNNGKTLDYYKTVQGTNWQDMVFRDAFAHNHSIAVRGGSDKTRYSISGNILDQDGVLVNSGFRRYQGRLSLDQTINTKIKAGINLNYSSTKRYGTIVAEQQSSPTASLMYSVWGYRPTLGDSAADANIEDVLFDPVLDPASDFRINPVLSAKNEYNPAFNNTFIANGYLEYKFNKYLNLRINGGITKTELRREVFNNSSTRGGHPRTNNGVNGSITNTSITNLLNENTLTYNRKFNHHNLNIMVGFSVQDIKGFSNGFTATQVPTESLGIKGLGQGTVITSPTSAPESGLLSYLGRINYNFKSKYLLTFSFRADGSSKFPTDNRWAYFPSAALAWKLKEENFLKNIDFLSDAKLRLGYGTTGNNRVAEFAAWSSLMVNNASGYSYGNAYGQGMIPINLGNDRLKWETTEQTNIGLDLAFLDERIALTVDYYKKKTKDLLLDATLAPSQGFLKGFRNIGKVSNEGLEFTLNTRNIESKNFSWSSSFNIAFNKNKVLALNDGEPSLATRVTWGNFNNAFPYIAIPDYPIAMYYGMLFDGIYQYSDFDQMSDGKYVLKANIPNNGNARPNIQPGDIKFRDINGDNKIDDNDLTIIGNPNPIHIGGFNNNFTYKNFDLNIFFQWSYGNDILNANRIEFEGGDPVTRNQLNMFKSFENRWTPDNQTNELYRVGGQGPAYYSSRTIEDGSFLRLKTVSLGYNIDPRIMKKWKMKALRVYLAAQNLYTWTNYSGLDPEVSTRPGALTPGFDFSSYPRTRTLTFGLNVGF